MTKLDELRPVVAERLSALAEKHRIPGATLGILALDSGPDGAASTASTVSTASTASTESSRTDGSGAATDDSGVETLEAATGLLSKATGVEVTTDAVFQIGSITKTWTATLVMQLVDEGRVELDERVRAYLPDFRVADEDASAAVTVRQLLAHTAGWDGDVFTPTTRDADAVARYVRDVMPTIAQSFPPGALFSYNNAAYAVLGRIVEVLREAPWPTVLRERLVDPLGLTSVATDAEEAILHRAAVGHVRKHPGDEPEPTSTWALPYSMGPVGAQLGMSVGDLLTYARMHLAGGLGPDGARLLSTASARAMREPQAEVPAYGTRPLRRGLGWVLFDWDGGGGPNGVIGHDGGTIGQYAFLRLVPERGIALALLTNGGGANAFAVELLGPLLRDLTGIEMAPRPAEPTERRIVANAERYVGAYQAHSVRLDVGADADGELWCTETPLGELAELEENEPERRRLAWLEGDRFVLVEPERGLHDGIVFVGSDDRGRAEFLHTSRAIPRVAEPDD